MNEVAYQPQYQAPPKWRAVLAKTSAVAAARWAAFCVWWMYRPAAEVEDLRWYAAAEDTSDSPEGQQAATKQQVGRHRAPEPEQPATDPWHEVPELTEQQHAEHQGATADWSPTGELRQIMAGELTPLEMLPSNVVVPEQRAPDMEALRQDTHNALEGWDDIFKPGLARIDAIIAAAGLRQYPQSYIAERAREATQSWPIIVPRTAELVPA